MESEFCGCGNPRRQGGRYCLSCHAVRSLESRRRNPLNFDQREKSNARAYAHVYLKRGKLKRQPCEVCGSAAQMHHDDYSRPLEVRWLCRFHHLELHHLSRPVSQKESSQASVS